MRRFYTCRGDNGYSDGKKKSDFLYEVLGSLDELQSYLGFVRSACHESDFFVLQYLQQCIFKIQAQVYNYKEANKTYITLEDILTLEKEMEKKDQHLLGIETFTLSGSNWYASSLDYSRALTRRVERHLVKFYDEQKYPLTENTVLKFINRLSSLLFVMSRFWDRDKTPVDYSAKLDIKD
jgi:cob(I)alamin adenosyltransferase